MIVKMLKAYIVARAADRDRLLEALRDLGVVHLAAVNPAKAVADADTTAAVDRLRLALQILENLRATGAPPALSPQKAAEEVLRIQRQSVEHRNRLAALHQQLEHLSLWGDVRLDDFKALRDAGLAVEFYAVPRAAVGQVRAECVEVLGPWPGRRVLLAAVGRAGAKVETPEGSQTIPLPARDRPSIRAEAAEVDQALQRDTGLLVRLAHVVPDMRRDLASLQEKARWTVATRSGLPGEHLYALQGWIPTELADTLAAGLARAGLATAVQCTEPQPGEEPPTLIKYPWWAKPMEGLFNILGTVPGYGEFDVSAMFMIFLPVFSAILISDTGYGLLYLVLPMVFYRKMAAAGVKPLAQLVIAIGVCSVIWGLLTCSFFGFDFSWLFGRTDPFIPVTMKKESMDALMLISITLGAVQLSLAHLWKAKAAFPSLAFLSEVGWSIWLWGMYGLVRMFLLKDPFGMDVFPYYPYLLIVGGTMAVLFAHPDRNPLKMLGLGLANFPLSAIGTFGDTVSYVRLMAIGLAGSALAGAFNDMGGQLPWYAMIPVLMAGHALNAALSIISLFAHGVRLNMLEFSNNLGMQWSGYAYEPFSRRRSQET
jgi:V/A-type H+-transporting ATPase subunit I